MSLPPVLHRVWRFFCTYEPVRHARWELVVMRFLFALLVWDTQTGWVAHLNDPPAILQAVLNNAQTGDIRYKSQPHPNGLAMWLDLTFFANDAIEKPLRMAVAASLVLYVLGVPTVLSLLVPMVFGIGTSTLSNSQGSIGHTSQVLHLTLLALWLAGVWGVGCRIRKKPLPNGWSAGEFEASWARQAIMAVYGVSALTKLVISGGDWLSSARYLPLHIVKSRDMKFYDNLDASVLRYDWLPQLMMDHSLCFIIIFGLALPLELFAFVGLYNRRSAALLGIALILFHEVVTQLMSLSFIFNKALLLVFFVAPWWWLARLLGGRRQSESEVGIASP
jgi:hypothetical protein